MTPDEIIYWEDQYDCGLVPKRPLALVRGRGARVWDADGREYIDCIGGHGVANAGHANPAVIEAVTEQVGRLTVCPNGYYNDQRARLMAELVRIAPAGLERVFLCNSGTEAVEAALKFARAGSGRTKVIAAMRGFHGRTFGALSATWRKEYRQPFEPLVPGFSFVPYNRLERMEQAVNVVTRLPPGLEAAELEREIRQWCNGARVEFHPSDPPFRAEKNTPLVRALLRAIRAEGGRPRFKLKTGTSDMNIVGPAWGCPIVAYGPGDSSLDHTPDEHIKIEEFRRAVEVLVRVLETLAGID
jgi:hypothetical protein